MPYDEENLYDDGTSSFYVSDTENQIHPQDTYSDRFSVSQRKTSAKPRPAIIASNSHMKNKDKIFSNKRTSSRPVGKVDMASVAEEARIISEKKDVANTAKNKNADTNVSEPNTTNSPNQKKVDVQPSNKPNDPTLENFRSSGLDSLFCSTSQTASRNDQSAPKESTVTSTKDDIKIPASTSKNKIDVKSTEFAGTAASVSKETMPVDPNITPHEDSNTLKTANEQYKKLRGERQVRVVRPSSFNSAKEIATALSAGNAVVVVCKYLTDENMKRILDFAFGAASVCGAKVSVEGEKVFAFTIGTPLTQREKLLCVKQGVIFDDPE